jgi:hypothetical protein
MDARRKFCLAGRNKLGGRKARLAVATAGQIIFTKVAALVIAFATAWWWRIEGFGWPASIAAGIGGYVFWKIVISVAIGRYQGARLRAEMDATADNLSNKLRQSTFTDDAKK